jgi:hypothetical protein
MPYAFLDSGGAPVEILPGNAFTTPQRRLVEGEEVPEGKALGDVIDDRVPHAYAVLGVWTEADFARYLVQNIGDAPEPGLGQMFASRDLVVTEGVISVAVTYADIPIEQAREAVLGAAQIEYDQRRQSPMTWDFAAIEAKDDTGASHGAAGVQTLQMRDTPDNPDQKNWQSAALSASVAVMAGQAATPVPLKTSANVWVQTTAQQALQVLIAGDGTQSGAFGRGLDMLRRYGALKAQINAAADTPAVMAIDLTAGWPA